MVESSGNAEREYMSESKLYTERIMYEVEAYSEKLLGIIIAGGMSWWEAKAGYMEIPTLIQDTKERIEDELKDIIYDLGVDSGAEVEKEYERIWESIDTAILHDQPEYTELKKKTKAELIDFIYDLYRDIDNLR